MRVSFVALVAALALTSTYDVVSAKTSMLTAADETVSARALGSEDNRSLKSRKEELDSDDMGVLEERAFGELLAIEDRAVANTRYRRWYKAKMTPEQVKKLLGVDEANLRKTQKELSRLYVGYYSYYSHMHRKRGSSDGE